MNIRINDREWRMNPQRIDQIVAEAYDAAARGTQGAIEAVEQALKNLQVTLPFPPAPPRPPKPSTPPSSGPSKPPAPPHRPQDDVDLEQERIAILHMVADGRITPEEGDMLLEGL
jgi:hypothetical protein